MNVLELLDKIEHFYNEFVKDVIEQDMLYAIAGYVFALLKHEFAFNNVELEEIDTNDNRIIFSINHGKEKTLKLEIHAKVPPKLLIYYD